MTDDKPKPPGTDDMVSYHSKSEMRRIEHMKEQKPDQPRDFVPTYTLTISTSEFKTVVEKSDYDALKKRCEELEQENKIWKEQFDRSEQENLRHQISFEKYTHLKEEDLAAAKAEIERLKEPVLMITDGPIISENITIDQRYQFEKKLTQANARIKELTEELKEQIGKWIGHREREQALVEALEHIERAYPTSGERMAHQDYAAKALKKHRGE